MRRSIAALLALLALAPFLLAPNAQDPGTSGRTTHIYANSGNATNFTVDIEAHATRGFKIAQICYTMSPATAAAAVTHALFRTTAASTGGTLVTREGTTVANQGTLAKADPRDANFAGIVRYNGSHTGGAVIDQWTVVAPVITQAGTPFESCRNYGLNGEKMPTVLPGVNNGVYFTNAAAGAGSVASGGIRIIIIEE